MDRRTVSRYLSMDEEAFEQYLLSFESRHKTLSAYEDFVKQKLTLYSDTSSAQMFDWLKEQYKDLPKVSSRTVFNFVIYVRQKHNLPLEKMVRDYFPVEELPYGKQAQVDFGQYNMRAADGKRKKVYFFAMVLSRSRMKFVLFSTEPFTAESVCQAHDNTLNQIGEQKTPDAGVSRFWYDRLGRLVVSQNAQQVLSKRYSYTVYDEIGRITQVGEKPQQTAMTSVISRDMKLLDNWLNATQDKESITRTVYDVSYYAGEEPGTLEPRLYQKNLRNRVSYTQLIDKEPAGTDARKWVTAHSAATYYSYDIHGNVKELLQDYNAKSMSGSGNRFKKIVYDYDLVSGKVNEVAYQPGYADQFFHRYSYDAENRLTDVETSDDRILWEKDARYYYYRHGPLGRAIIGGQQVQGLDYAYTLQGWLKGVNSSNVNAPAGKLGLGDMGGDGYGLLNPVARDAFGFGLSYYQNDAQGEVDYKPVAASAGVKPFANAAAAGFGFKALYNGNIAAMSVNIPKIGEPLLYTYQYDQLNRFVKYL